MPATPQTIWKVPAYLPFLQPPLTDEMVAAKEKEIGHRLPREYLDLLRVQNGGYIKYRLGHWNEQIAGIGPILPTLESIYSSATQKDVSFPLRGLFSFDGDGHWLLCLDYRKDPAKPCVSYINVEDDSQTHIADSFVDYLSLLKLEVRDDEFVVEGATDIEAVKSMLATSLKMKFNPVDTLSHGYPQHIGRYGNGWVNLSPNTVPRGFVRPNDPRYQELKDLLPGESQRFPPAPADSIIMLTTQPPARKLLEALAKAGLRLRPLREYEGD